MKTLRLMILAGFLGAAAVRADSTVSGIWQGRWLFVRFNIQVAQWNSQVAGVATVRPVLGSTYVYHFNGTAEGNRLSGAHHSGHRFEGTRTTEDVVEGILTTRRGRTLRLTLRRSAP